MALRPMVRQIGAASLSVALCLLIFTLTAVQAQEPKSPAPAPKTPQAKTTKPSITSKQKAKAKGSRLVPGGPVAKGTGKADDPIGKGAAQDAKVKAAVEEGAYHYQFKMVAGDASGTLAASYYPSKLGTGAAVILLVHEKDRSIKDFQDPIAELDNFGLAEYLQKQGFAVLAIDLRGQGANQRRATSAKDWRQMPIDLQTAYIFLLDRHNRGELNLARLGVLGIGEGANLAMTWASTPGAATTSTEAGKTDISCLVLISPMADAHAHGLPIQRPITTLASKIPLCLLTGERDQLSSTLVKAVQVAVKRYRTNQVTLYPSSLHGYKLLRLEPEITKAITRFLDETVKARPETWEPRYNLAPITYSDVKTLANPKAGAANTENKADAAAPKAKEAAK